MVNFKSRAKFCKFVNYVYVVDIFKDRLHCMYTTVYMYMIVKSVANVNIVE
jgi:hypothetical protein